MWNLSIRFWVGGRGERLTNPIVLCLNLLSCSADTKQEAAVRFKFGIQNQNSEEWEMGAEDKVRTGQMCLLRDRLIVMQAMVMMEKMDKLKSVGYKNIAITDQHINSDGDVSLSVQLSISLVNENLHCLASDLGFLINHAESSDLILETGDKKFRVHKNILAARSPVFALLLAKSEDESQGIDSFPVCHSIVEETEEDIAQMNTEEGNLDKGKEYDHQNEMVNVNGSEGNLLEEGSKKNLIITDLPPKTVEQVLRYIYTDTVENIDLDPYKLLAASDMYQVIQS